MNIEAQKKIAASISIASNTIIIILKFIAGYISGSISIISEAIHSCSDLFASALTLFAINRSSEPADKGHPFGHGKYEDMAGFIEGILIILAGLFIVIEATKKIVTGYHSNAEPLIGIIVMAIAIVTNFLVSKYMLKIAQKADSVSLFADAKHLSTDMYSALGVLIGLMLIKITHLTILDPIIAILVSFIILKAGLSITKETLNNLLDGSISNEDLQKIEQILNNNSVIKGYKNLKGRKIGHTREIEITLLFNPDMKISCCHVICDQIENEIKTKVGKSDITIHAEPFKKC